MTARDTLPVYHEPYQDTGWVCAVTHRPVKIQPTRFMPLPQPPERDDG